MLKKILPASGFTLIELLVVISIIGILTGIGFASFEGARERARDARRKGDLRQIAVALKLYYNDKGSYPVSIAPPGVPNANAGGAGWQADCWQVNANWIHNSGNYAALQPYMNTQPHDPKRWCLWPYDTTSGTYIYASDGRRFALVARLENENDPDRTQIKHYKFPWTGADTATFVGVGNPYTYWFVSN